MMANDHCNPKASAINPISGGPIRNPRKPILETAASAIPGDSVSDLPASLYTNGTTEETPKPTSKYKYWEKQLLIIAPLQS
jgi:hypothetical protein